jgi:hypothetical protein
VGQVNRVSVDGTDSGDNAEACWHDATDTEHFVIDHEPLGVIEIAADG